MSTKANSDQTSVYYIVASIMDAVTHHVNAALYVDLDKFEGQLGIVEDATGVANDFLNWCDDNIDFDFYDGCFPYDMHERFAAAYADALSSIYEPGQLSDADCVCLADKLGLRIME